MLNHNFASEWNYQPPNKEKNINGSIAFKNRGIHFRF